MQRFSLFALVLFGTAVSLVPAPLLAAEPLVPSLAAVAADPDDMPSFVAHPKKGATIEGTVTAVDYAGNTFTLDSGGGHKTLVIVKPSTDFEGSPGYHSMTDIVKGSSVSVLSSVVGEKTYAEIVTLRSPSPAAKASH